MAQCSYPVPGGARLLGLGLAFLLAASFGDAAQPEERLITDTFVIKGMTCGGCEIGVEIALRQLDGVRSADASYHEGTATVSYDPEKICPEQIVAAIEKLGYQAKRVDPTAPKPESNQEPGRRQRDPDPMRNAG